jgi:hypothetical protein
VPGGKEGINKISDLRSPISNWERLKIFQSNNGGVR